jgi:hypothetical protein
MVVFSFDRAGWGLYRYGIGLSPHLPVHLSHTGQTNSLILSNALKDGNADGY